MGKDVGKIRKNDNTEIVVRIDDFGGKIGLTIREFTSSERYTGFTKSGTRIPAESFKQFKEIIDSIQESDLAVSENPYSKPEERPEQNQKTLNEDTIEEEVF